MDQRAHGDRTAMISEPGLAPVIAIVGSDGAGKSTVCNALRDWLGESRVTALFHLGKQTGDFRRQMVAMPLIGSSLARKLKSGGKTLDCSSGADALSALVTYRVSMRRLRRFRNMLALRRRGVTVIADRYPQTAVPGSKMDGPHLVVPNPKSLITRLLTRREQAHYAWMTSYRPDLVIRLQVDLATASARKPQHDPEALRHKIALTPQLSFNGAPIVDIDSTQPLALVLDHAKRAISETLSRRARQGAGPAAFPGAPTPSSAFSLAR